MSKSSFGRFRLRLLDSSLTTCNTARMSQKTSRPPTLSAKEHLVLELLVANGPSYGLQLVSGSRGQLKRGTVYVTLGRWGGGVRRVGARPGGRGPSSCCRGASIGRPGTASRCSRRGRRCGACCSWGPRIGSSSGKVSDDADGRDARATKKRDRRDASGTDDPTGGTPVLLRRGCRDGGFARWSSACSTRRRPIASSFPLSPTCSTRSRRRPAAVEQRVRC